jgi:hypothetical protein
MLEFSILVNGKNVLSFEIINDISNGFIFAFLSYHIDIIYLENSSVSDIVENDILEVLLLAKKTNIHDFAGNID